MSSLTTPININGSGSPTRSPLSLSANSISNSPPKQPVQAEVIAKSVQEIFIRKQNEKVTKQKEIIDQKDETIKKQDETIKELSYRLGHYQAQELNKGIGILNKINYVI